MKAVASPACIFLKYSGSVQFAATPRSAVCQVCMWALMSPGMTMQPVASMRSASSTAMLGAISVSV